MSSTSATERPQGLPPSPDALSQALVIPFLLAGESRGREEQCAELERLLGRSFHPFHPGVEMLPLYRFPQNSDGVCAPASAFLHYRPGASVPCHAHPGYEHILVLTGSQQDEQNVYRRGSCLISPPGSQHRIWSVDGCLVLATWTKPVEVLQ